MRTGPQSSYEGGMTSTNLAKQGCFGNTVARKACPTRLPGRRSHSFMAWRAQTPRLRHYLQLTGSRRLGETSGCAGRVANTRCPTLGSKVWIQTADPEGVSLPCGLRGGAC
eukprot:366383-Chlamydomonas_euryale.AAC.3